MTTLAAEREIRTLDIVQEISIAAPADVAFAALLEELGPGSVTPDGKPFPMKLEPWPGGRWFRDLGNNTGHFWGHVQVFKPPTLLELRGPMFMSYPSENFVQYRLTAAGKGTELKLTHQAFGWITQDLLEGVNMGWKHGINRVRELAERRASAAPSR